MSTNDIHIKNINQMKKSQQKHQIQKALNKIEPILEEIVQKGFDEPLAKYWSRELEGPVNDIRKALELE